MIKKDINALQLQLEQEKQEMFSAIVETTPNFIAIIQDEKFAFINSAGLHLLNCKDSNNIVGKEIFEIVHPDLHNDFKKRLHNLTIKSNEPILIQLLQSDGEYVNLEASFIPFVYKNKPAGLIAGKDVTNVVFHKKRIEVEKNLREAILNSFPELIAFYNIDHKIRWLNNAAKEYFGITDDSYIGKYCYQVRFQSNHPCLNCPISSNIVKPSERIINENGIFWEIRHTPLINDKGEIHGYIEFSTNITEKENRKKKLIEAEDELRESEQRFREIFENNNDNISLLEVTKDRTFRYLDFNPAFEKTTGYKRMKTSGRIFEDVASEDRKSKIGELYHLCMNKKQSLINHEIELRTPNGNSTFLFNIIPIPDYFGNIYRILEISRDITERKRLEKLLLKKQINLQDAQRIGKIGSWEHNIKDNHWECSPEISRIYELGPSKDPISNDSLTDFIHPEDREKVTFFHNKLIPSY